MERIPLRIQVTVPENIPELRGRHATSAPFGSVITIRMTADAMQVTDDARRLIDPDMSRGLFMRQAIERVAIAINQHYHEYVKQQQEKMHGPASVGITKSNKRIRS